jgi:hypothetical protein
MAISAHAAISFDEQDIALLLVGDTRDSGPCPRNIFQTEDT